MSVELPAEWVEVAARADAEHSGYGWDDPRHVEPEFAETFRAGYRGAARAILGALSGAGALAEHPDHRRPS